MSSTKSLSSEHINRIQSWADGGDGLPEIQKKLGDELDIRITYLETRFLLEDLKIELLPPPVPEPEIVPEETVPEETISEDVDSGTILNDSDGEGIPHESDLEGTAKVTVDALLRPGAIISGKVDFGGEKTATWWLDQMGRLGMDVADPQFRPSESQVTAFQNELRKVIEKSGF